MSAPRSTWGGVRTKGLLAAVLVTGVVLGGGTVWVFDHAGAGAHDRADSAGPVWSGSIARFGGASPGEDGRLIITYDPRTGQRTGRYATHWKVSYPNLDVGISPDRTWAAASTSRGLEIGRRSGTSFTTVRTITTADLEPQDRDSTYPTSPHFLDNNRLIFAAEQVDDTGFMPLGGYVLDLTRPSSAPVRTTDGTDQWDSAGRPVTAARLLPVRGLSTIDGHRVEADLSGSTAGLAYADINDDRVEHTSSPYYRCNQPLDAHSLLCMADLYAAARGGYDPPRGTVAILRRAADGESATLTRLVGTLPAHPTPAKPEGMQDVYLSPDKKTLLMVTSQGWYSAGVDGSHVRYRYPHLGAVPVGDDEFLDGWGPHHYTYFNNGIN